MSDDSGSSSDPRQSGSVPNSLSQLQHAYATGSDSVIPATLYKHFNEQDWQSYCSDLDAPSQPSKHRRIPSVSLVKRWQVAVSELDFDSVESHSLFDSPSNRKRGLNVNDVLCVQSESLLTFVQEH